VLHERAPEHRHREFAPRSRSIGARAPRAIGRGVVDGVADLRRAHVGFGNRMSTSASRTMCSRIVLPFVLARVAVQRWPVRGV